MALSRVAGYVVAGVLLCLMGVSLFANHSGPNGADAPLLIFAAAIFYVWGSVSLVTGRCSIKGCPPGGFTADDQPGQYWFGVYALYAMCGLWLFVACHM